MPKQPHRHHFVFTWNNFNQEVLDKCDNALGKCGISYIVYGKEIGEQGTPHLQGYFQSNTHKFDRFQKYFGNCWIKRALGSDQEAYEYCTKEGDFKEYGERIPIASSKERQGQRSDLSAVHEAINAGKSFSEICDDHFETAAKFWKFIQSRINHKQQQDYLEKKREELSSASLRPWQQSLLDVVEQDPHPRAVHWIWEAKGAVGKSWMAKYLAIMNDALVLQIGKKADLAHIVSQIKTKIVIFDLSRTTEENPDFLNGVFALAEDLKNGYLLSTKYESRVIHQETVHLIFFANYPPPTSKMSDDRWIIKEL